jgi:AcrR family transcriptional regulator
MTPTPSRHRLIATARERFSREGIRATGMDALAREAGVAKGTLYHHFASKDALVAAYLEDADCAERQALDALLAPVRGRPGAGILALFDAVAAALRDPAYHGCPFLNAAVEFATPGHPVRAQVWRAKRAVRDRLAAALKADGYSRPARLAEHLALLMDGALARGLVAGSDGPARAAKAIARTLLDAARP